MHVNVANPTLQDWVFAYRLGAPGSPDMKLLRHIVLPSGTQIDVGHEWDRVQKAQFIGLLEAQGARDAAESHGHMTKFSGLLYRDIGEITTAEIEMAHESELQTREDRSVQQVVRSALGFDKSARKETGQRPGARITETTVEQEMPRNTRRKGNEMKFSMTVDPEGRSDIALPV